MNDNTARDDDDLTDEAREDLQSPDFHREMEAISQGDEDAPHMGNRARRKIHKERWRRKHAEEERDRIKAERDQALKELEEYRTKESESIDTQMDDIKKRRDEALEEGELGTYGKLNDELYDLRDRKNQSVRKPEPKQEVEETRISDATMGWVDNNRDWLNVDKEKTQVAARIERQLVKEGYDLNDDELYEELDRRLSNYGDEPDIDDDDTPAYGATTGVPRDTASPNARRTGNRLTAEDLRKMARFGFDPNSKEDRDNWRRRNEI